MSRSPSYSIFVKFRASRLTLRRGIPGLDEALTVAHDLRRNRFHDHDSVFVVRYPEGVVVDERARIEPEPAAAAPAAEASAPSPAPLVAAATPVVEAAAEPAPPRSRSAHALAQIVTARERVARVRRAIEIADATDARVGAALEAADARIGLDGRLPPRGIEELQRRTRAMHAQTREAARALERLTTRVSEQVERSWHEAVRPR